MKKVTVKLPANEYEILIAPGLLADTGKQLKETGFGDKIVIVTNPKVRGLHGKSLENGLTGSGFKPSFLEIPDGEEFKTLESAGRLFESMGNVFAERSTPVIALGGGVIGDLAGFVAATYMRGVPLIQVPTTLLAQVDSSIGGKVAVDHGRLKNMVGCFYQPRAVFTDVSVLKTLDPRQMSNGLAEVIKYGIIKDPELFAYLEQNLERIKARDEEALEEIVYRCAAIKARLVEEDEKDMGQRHLLNYGHTVGHGTETASNFKLSHGEAVAIGMIVAAKISRKMGLLNDNDVTRIRSLIERAGLPAGPGELHVENIINAIGHDKKIADGQLKFILARSIGDAFISRDVTLAMIKEVLISSK